MKKLTLIFGLLLVAGFVARAQTDACQSGFCPETLTAHHYAGVAGVSVAPETVEITYNVKETDLSGTTACWITQNLGALNKSSASASTEVTERGWFWQCNRKVGYAYNGSLIPAVTWDTTLDDANGWEAENDPCTLLLGEYWRMPTQGEWNAADGWISATGAYNSVLKLGLVGNISATGGWENEGTGAIYWASTGTALNGSGFDVVASTTLSTLSKVAAYPMRCLRTYSW